MARSECDGSSTAPAAPRFVGAQSNSTFLDPGASRVHTYLVELTSSPFTSADVRGGDRQPRRPPHGTTRRTPSGSTAPVAAPVARHSTRTSTTVATGVRLGVGSYEPGAVAVPPGSPTTVSRRSGCRRDYTVTAYADSGFAGTSWVFNADNREPRQAPGTTRSRRSR